MIWTQNPMKPGGFFFGSGLCQVRQSTYFPGSERTFVASFQHAMAHKLLLRLAFFLGTLPACKADASILLQVHNEQMKHERKTQEALGPFANLPTNLLEVFQNCKSGVSILSPIQSGSTMIVIMPRSSPMDFMVLNFTNDTAIFTSSVDVAAAKAWTALTLSNDQVALTSGAMGQMDEKSLMKIQKQLRSDRSDLKINTLPGGIPLYKDKQLIGAVGVSGVDAEALALACATGFEAPQDIQLGNPYANFTNPLVRQKPPAKSTNSGESVANLPLFLANFLPE